MITIKKNIDPEAVGLTLILFANICLYNERQVYWFIGVGALGIITVVISTMRGKNFILHMGSYPIWLSLIYALFAVYQIFALRAGNSTLDTMIWRYVENLCIYTVILKELRRGKKFDLPFIIAGILSIIMILRNEMSLILTIISKNEISLNNAWQFRIGTTLSGNENTVGFAFGVISVVIMWTYCQEHPRRKTKMGLFVVFTLFMLMTGSKKTIFFLMTSVIIYLYFDRGKFSRWIKILLIIGVLLYVIFKVELVYNILGYRIINAIKTMLYGKKTVGAVYSYSTDVRKAMMVEAFQLFKEHPIAGGGYNFFLLKTQNPYSYSHCNYTELLCSFGIIGSLMFYSRHIYQLKYTVKMWMHRKNYRHDIMCLGFMCTMLILLIEIAAVTFSAQSLWYLPITISAACYDYLIENVKLKRGD